MGDASDVLDTIFMHSVVYTNLAKQNLIDFIPDSEGKVRFPTYLGYQVVKDDGCPAVAGTNRPMYHTYLVGKNAIGWAESPAGGSGRDVPLSRTGQRRGRRGAVDTTAIPDAPVRHQVHVNLARWPVSDRRRAADDDELGAGLCGT